MAVVAPEAAGVTASLAYMILALVAFLGYIVARGLLATWTHSIGYMLNWLAGELKFTVGVGFAKASVDLGGPFREVDRLVITALQSWASGLEAETAYFWHGSATIAEWTAGQVSGLADDTADAFEWLTHSFIPRSIDLAGGLVHVPGNLVKLIDAEVERLLRGIDRITHVITHDITHVITKVGHAAGGIVIPSPWAIPGFRGLWHDLTTWRTHVARRLSRLERLLGVAGMAAVMANVLGLPNWRCLTRGNVGKTARHLCGLSPTLLNDFLGLLTDLLILQDVCRIITLMEQGLALVQPEITAFITGAEAWACYGDNEAPPQMPAPALSLPPSFALTLSLP